MRQPSDSDHKCFGCQKQIADHEPHMHLTMDEFAEWQGLPALGMDDLLKFTVCEGCTQEGGRWQLEAHEIGESA